MSASLALAADTSAGAVSVAVTGMPVPVATLTAPTATVQRRGPSGPWATVRGLIGAAIDGSGVVATVLDSEFIPGVVNTYRAGTDQTVVDQFGRTVAAGGWGTPDSGAAWSASSSLLSVSTGKGRATHASANTSIDVLTTDSYGDATLEVSAGVTAAITGGTQITAVYGRYVDASNYYRASVTWSQTAGALTLTVIARKGGVDTTLSSAALSFTHSGSTTTLRIILECTGTTIAVTVYDASGAPPSSPTYSDTVPVAARITSGMWGVRSTRSTGNTNTNAETVWDNLLLDAGEPYFTDTDTITMDLDRFWLKSIQRSFLNLSPLVVGYEEPSRDARGGSSSIVGRTLPIAQVELMTGRTWPLDLKTRTLADARKLEYLLASGDVLLLQCPSDCPIPSGTYRAKGMSGRRESERSDNRVQTVPLEECAAPGPDVVTASVTWETVLATFATWEAVALVYPTWEALLTLVGDPAEVIVP